MVEKTVVENDSQGMLVFVSAFTTGEEGAIHKFYLDADSGQLTQVHRTTDVENPFFLALSPNKQFLYSIHAPGDFLGAGNNKIAAYKIAGQGGHLESLNRQQTLGSGACYIDLDAAGKAVLVANYSTGSVVSFAVHKDGSLSEASSFFQHAGASIDKDRQSGPHAHCIVFSPDNRFAFAADLGLDRIQSYRFEPAATRLIPNDPTHIDTHPGSGPRHLLFHPAGESVYVANELNSSITVFDYEANSGTLSIRQTISTLADNFDSENHPADLRITRDGQFLYCTNRGHDSIVVYRVGGDGELELSAIASSCGESPQSLAITPCGTFLLCANMAGGCVAVFRIDAKTGELVLTGEPVAMPAPSCIAIR